MEFLSTLLNIWQSLALWLVGLAALFFVLSYLTPCNKGQSFWRKGMLTDISYFFVMPILNRMGSAFFIAVGMSVVAYGKPEETMQDYLLFGYGWLSTLPLWLQAAMMFIISDFLLYWLHRWFHGKQMWKFHAIHHSPEQVDWLSTYRFHPINSWLAFTLVDSLMLLSGFSPAALGVLATFNVLYSPMVHANLNWTFGPFKYLFASPVFHRWHHTSQAEGMDKNFAPTFPIFDVMFGTFYMPEGRLPEQYGISGTHIPDGFVPQTIWPFTKGQ